MAHDVDEAPVLSPHEGAGPPGGGTAAYLPVGDEVQTFGAAAAMGLPVLLKGPTGCGKTRFVEAMAARLQRPLITVACHEDLTAADLTGRHLLRGDETVWVDGPLTRAVRQGAICYLDEVVEARADTVVVIHSLTDHRRALTVDRNGEVLEAPPEFMLVMSFNPGYQSVIKDLKDSTRQRMVAIDFGFPPSDVEERVIQQEAQADPETAQALVRLGQAIRGARSSALREVTSTRTLVNAALLHRAGLDLRRAAYATCAAPLSDDPEVLAGLAQVIDTYLGPVSLP